MSAPRENQSRLLDVSTDTPQPPTIANTSSTTWAFTFPKSHESDPCSIALSPSLVPCKTPPLTRDLSSDPVSPTFPAPLTPKCHTSSPDPVSRTISDTKPWSKDYIRLPACRECRSNRGVCLDLASTTLAFRLRHTSFCSWHWQGFSTEERQYWEYQRDVIGVYHLYPSRRATDKKRKTRMKGTQYENQVSTQDFHFPAIANGPPSNPADTEHRNCPSRDFGDVNGGYTEHDNRKIDRNIENCGVYCEGDRGHTVNNNGDWKIFVTGGGVATTAFYAGHTTARIERPSIPTNNAIAITYSHYSFDQVPSLVVSLLVLPVVLINLLSLFRQSVPTAFAG
ncbi:hypothetical protein K435DRAFT_966234 [Dendrothele bispora CBS 962.96]|uniref:Uncharacterized protein n=1 Tax=Dendrothele bispora (strain CBS 962.96) TaxID=1314807 RepID=A0A4S8M166_DENBC|nr:hypothetical protein K435DRAFT_966234 [Dendrothele bispora CBS 962.96]